MQTGNPEQLRLLTQTDRLALPEIAERALHDTLAMFRIRGEWFRDCEEVRFACSLCSDQNFWKFTGGT
jgi:hypothetical protein